MAERAGVRAEKCQGTHLLTSLGTEFVKMIEGALMVVFPGQDRGHLVVRLIIGRFCIENFLVKSQSLRPGCRIGGGSFHIHAAKIQVCGGQLRTVTYSCVESLARGVLISLLDFYDAE
jgi:hypothetical protein